MNDTQNYHLPQFAESDRIHHDDFNDAFAKIDTAVKTNSTAIASKASTADLTAEATARQNADTAEATARANADTALQNNIDAEAAARAAADSAIHLNLGAKGHNLRVISGSYVGSGNTHSNTNRMALTFDHFYPVAVLFSSTYQDAFGGYAIRPFGARSGNYWESLNVLWTDNGLSWYCSDGSDADSNMDKSGQTYQYHALGYDI